jgi:hypothetical protein
MPLILTEEQADSALRRLCQPTVDPTLDAQELSDILAACVVGTGWEAAAAYSYGDVVIPATRNGHRFICIVAGTSDDAEPSWPSWDNATVTDGSTLTWQEIGPECDLWDMRAAAEAAFDLKISKAAACGVDFRTPSLQVSNSQLIANLERQRDRYRPITIA